MRDIYYAVVLKDPHGAKVFVRSSVILRRGVRAYDYTYDSTRAKRYTELKIAEREARGVNGKVIEIDIWKKNPSDIRKAIAVNYGVFLPQPVKRYFENSLRYGAGVTFAIKDALEKAYEDGSISEEQAEKIYSRFR